jgi:magnesium chelatase family protein
MGMARTLAVALTGLRGTLVEVEADVSTGLPNFSIVGLPDSSTLQARERVRAAADRTGTGLKQQRLTVNLTPAYLRKHGSGFDLAIAVALLAAQEVVHPEQVARTVHIGELGLDGRLRPVPGVLPALMAAREQGIRRAVVPLSNLEEARLVPGIELEGAEDLAQVLQGHGARGQLTSSAGPPHGSGPAPADQAHDPTPPVAADFRDVIGQHQARHAAEVAAAGGHHLLLSGPPGAGKTMIAARIPGILPPLEVDQALALSAVLSVDGRFDASGGLHTRPPFENPHHTATTAAIVGGGGGIARPGAISRAHGGVLFLDEAPEFPTAVLEALREPLESGDVTLHRARGAVRYPARFQLVLAANPCPCGKAWGTGKDCTCTPMQRRRYLGRLSGPVLDRIDMRVMVGPVDRGGDITGMPDGESTAAVAGRVARARRRQRERFATEPWTLNAQIPGPALRGRYGIAERDRRLLDHAIAHGRLTLRGHDRVLRLAWTLADLAGRPRPTAEQIGLALTLRGGESR